MGHTLLRRCWLLALALSVALPLIGCARPWQLSVQLADGPGASLNPRQWQALADAYPQDVREDEALALERVLRHAGASVVESIQVAGQSYPWVDHHADSWLLKDGTLRLDGESVRATRLMVTPPAESARLRLIDLAPTMAGALSVRSPAGTRGQALGAFRSPRVVVVAIDGLGWLAFQDVRKQNITALLDGLSEPKRLLSAYPSTADAAMLAVLCGSEATAVSTPRPETLFDVLAEAGMSGVAVLSGASSASLGPAEVIRVSPASPDEDLTSVAVDTALSALRERTPALLWLQLDSLARAAAVYGLGTDEATQRLSDIDGQLHRLIAEVPSGALLVIVGTHGVHPVAEGGVLAAGGSLLASDMLVPLWVVEL